MDNVPSGPDHYRIVDRLTQDGVIVRCDVYVAIKETQKGYWVVGKHMPIWSGMTFEELYKSRYVRWVSKSSNRSFCYSDLKRAIESFNKRKSSQVARLKLQLEQAELAKGSKEHCENATISELQYGVNVGQIPSANVFNWDW